MNEDDDRMASITEVRRLIELAREMQGTTPNAQVSTALSLLLPALDHIVALLAALSVAQAQPQRDER